METGRKEKGNEKTKTGTQSDGAQTQKIPKLSLGNISVGNICLEEQLQNNQKLNFKPQFLGLRNCLQAWVKIGANQTLIKTISKGVKAPLKKAPVVHPLHKRQEKLIATTIGEYLAAGAIKKWTPKQQQVPKVGHHFWDREKNSQKLFF